MIEHGGMVLEHCNLKVEGSCLRLADIRLVKGFTGYIFFKIKER